MRDETRSAPLWCVSGVITILLTLAPGAAADVVHLRNGHSIVGRVVERGELLLLTVAHQTLTLRRSEVVRIERTKPEGSAAYPAPAWRTKQLVRRVILLRARDANSASKWRKLAAWAGHNSYPPSTVRVLLENANEASDASKPPTLQPGSSSPTAVRAPNQRTRYVARIPYYGSDPWVGGRFYWRWYDPIHFGVPHHGFAWRPWGWSRARHQPKTHHWRAVPRAGARHSVAPSGRRH